jgi:hypothetical protein
MQNYRNAIIMRSYIGRCWLAVFGYGDHVVASSRKAARAAVDSRIGK